jgi:hypothetical protein
MKVVYNERTKEFRIVRFERQFGLFTCCYQLFAKIKISTLYASYMQILKSTSYLDLCVQVNFNSCKRYFSQSLGYALDGSGIPVGTSFFFPPSKRPDWLLDPPSLAFSGH